MEWLLWTTYLSGEAWILGYPIMLTLGPGIYTYIFTVATIQAFETDLFGGTAPFDAWLAGPFLRGYVTGPLIFSMNVFFTLIPGVNFVTAILFGWWACADYYSYSYAFFGGPLLP